MLSKSVLQQLGLKPVASSLFKKPEKDTGVNMAHITIESSGIVHQCDLLFLPNDGGYKYALVVVDVKSRLTDARPVKTKEPKDVLEAMKDIYKGKYLKQPSWKIECDNGTEFQGIFKKYFEDQGLTVKTGKAGRHRQQGMAESRNGQIGKAIMLYENAQEQIYGETSREWVSFLPKLIKILNDGYQKKTEKEDAKKGKKIPLEIQCKGSACDIIPIGTKVRAILDNPEAFITGKREHGGFRAGDTRWSADVRTVENVLLQPPNPPMYVLNGDRGKVAYTKNQLQLIKDSDEPVAKEIFDKTKKDGKHQLKEILERKKENNKYMYKVRWVGFPDPKDYTWEPRANLSKEVYEAFDKKIGK